MKTDKKKIGDQGENKACTFLIDNGFEIIQRNYRKKSGEIDIIALKTGRLHFIEVKTRYNNYFGQPEEAVDKQKMDRLVATANHYLIEMNSDLDYSFDIISIKKTGSTFAIRHFMDAFFPGENHL